MHKDAEVTTRNLQETGVTQMGGKLSQIRTRWGGGVDAGFRLWNVASMTQIWVRFTHGASYACVCVRAAGPLWFGEGKGGYCSSERT